MTTIRARGAQFGFTSARPLSSALLVALVACAACDKKAPEPAAEPAPAAAPQPVAKSSAANATQPGPATAPAEALQITWVDPPAFKRVPPPNPMRKASYVIPRATGDDEDGELSVFYFGAGQGGGTDANVERWVKQFGDVKPGDVRRADREANGLRQHTVELDSGTFSAGMGMGSAKPKPNYGLLGGIVEAPSGSYFFKLTGPSKTVAQAKLDFYKLLDSIKPN